MKLSKARSLDYVSKKISLFEVPEFMYFKVESFQKDSATISKKIQSKFIKGLIVVRSSAANEDGAAYSAAGEYDSVLDVRANNLSEIKSAIKVVLLSYKNKGENYNDEIIVQRMISDVSMSGVIFTYELNTGAPYYVINYDDVSGLTDTVTSGNGEYANRTLYVHRDSINSIKSDRFKKLLVAVKELEDVFQDRYLDIEFALDNEFNPQLFQVRKITSQNNWNKDSLNNFDLLLNGIKEFISNRFDRVQGVYGKTTIFGQMPDWNPVEMIGRSPRALSFSLYQKIITDNAWSNARGVMGYKVPVGQPLMLGLAGQPYIDVRLSFNSFLPKDLPPEISNKLIDKWIQRLESNPEFHDKVEFDVAITCFSFDIDNKIKTLIGDALNISEKNIFKKLITKLTINLVEGKGAGSIEKAMEKVDSLDRINKNTKWSESIDNLSNLFTMIDNCINLGTIPFSILARHGFIGRSILLSLQSEGVISELEVGEIQASVETVASELVNDMRSFQTGEISEKDFMNRYGHLRPGTYDIISPRYDQMSNLVNSVNKIPSKKPAIMEYQFNPDQKDSINKLLKKEGFNQINADSLLDYIRQSIIGREYGKFVFTNTLSNILEFIASFGSNIGLDREQMSNIPIDLLLQSAKSSNREKIDNLLKEVSFNESKAHISRGSIRLPQLLFDKEGVNVIPFQVSHPNFITNKKISANCEYLKFKIDEVSLSGKIILIEGADPGFDWIFTQKIAGLITKFGGANSHMAIRCAEFEIPAAIGCGEQIFERILNATKIDLDCAADLINVVH